MKVKVFFALWFIGASLGCAQNPNHLKTSLKLLQNPSEFRFPIDSTGFSKVKNAQFFSARGDNDVFTIDPKNVHLIDFNNDGLKDIIYQDSRHYDATILFANKDNNFTEIWSGPGRLIQVKQGKETTISILSHFMGCNPISLLIELGVDADNSVTEGSIGLHNKTSIEKMSETFEQQTISGILRTNPLVDNKEKKDPCTGDLVTGNHIRIMENEIVNVIHKEKEWWLVCYKKNTKEITLIGWVKMN